MCWMIIGTILLILSVLLIGMGMVLKKKESERKMEKMMNQSVCYKNQADETAILTQTLLEETLLMNNQQG